MIFSSFFINKWIFIKIINCHGMMNLHHSHRFSLQWSILIKMMNFLHKYNFLSQFWFSKWWIFIMAINFHYNDVFYQDDDLLSKWWVFMNMGNLKHKDEFSSQWWILSQWLSLLVPIRPSTFSLLFNSVLLYTSITKIVMPFGWPVVQDIQSFGLILRDHVDSDKKY